MSVTGKGFMIWKIERCEGGDADAIANVAYQAGLTYVLIKIANGTLGYNINKNGNDLVPAVVQALRSKGIQVWGWHYVYGYYPSAEAQIAVRRVQELNLDGYVIDAEYEYKQAGRANAALEFMSELRSGIPNTPVALCSYRFPKYHPELPWKEFLDKCDYNMPQVYWEKAHNPGYQLQECIKQFKNIAPFRPIIPVGPIYMGTGNWSATPAEITEFLNMAKNLNLESAYFYEWYYGRTILSSLWDAVIAFPWGTAPTPPSTTTPIPTTPIKEIPELYIDLLNKHDENKVCDIYTGDAVHITAAKTIQGIKAIRLYYKTFLSEAFTNATFKITGLTKTGNSYNFTWEANSSTANVKNGNDTVGILDGKIAYHYSYYTIS